MNPWAIFLQLLSWVGLMLALFAVFVIFWAIMEGLWKGLKKIVLKNRDDLDLYLREARAVADDADPITQDPNYRAGFMHGVRWGWGFHHRLLPPKR